MIQRQIGSDRFDILLRMKDGTIAEGKIIDLVVSMIDEQLTGVDTKKLSRDDVQIYVNHVTRVIAGRFDLVTTLIHLNN